MDFCLEQARGRKWVSMATHLAGGIRKPRIPWFLFMKEVKVILHSGLEWDLLMWKLKKYVFWPKKWLVIKNLNLWSKTLIFDPKNLFLTQNLNLYQKTWFSKLSRQLSVQKCRYVRPSRQNTQRQTIFRLRGANWRPFTEASGKTMEAWQQFEQRFWAWRWTFWVHRVVLQ